MARKAPPSPALADAALDAALARAPRPALPPGLAARIVAQATALPQHDAQAAPALRADEDAVQTAQVIAFTPQVVTESVETRRWPRPMLAGGFAALAAVMVAAVMIGQQGQSVVAPADPAALAVRQNAAPAAAEQIDTPQAAVQVAEIPAPVTAVRVASAQPAATVRAKASAEPETVVSPAPAAAPDAQLAVSVPPVTRESAGPTADPSARPVPRGVLVGPPAPQQGWAFSGGAASGGATLPSGQSLPNQTTGSGPPPPPPPGH